MYKLLIVDDDMLARAGMKMLIDWNTYGYQVIDAVDSADAALKIMEKDTPDVVFTDVVMHGMDGVELTRIIKERYPQVLVVALSCYTDVDYVKNIIRMGAEDYLQKLSMSPEDVISLLETLSKKLDEKHQKNDQPKQRKNGLLLLQMLLENRDDDTVLMNRLDIDPDAEKQIMVIKGLPGGKADSSALDKAADLIESKMIEKSCFARTKEDEIILYSGAKSRSFNQNLSEEICSLSGALCVGFSRNYSGKSAGDHIREAEEAALSVYLHPSERIHFFEHENKTRLSDLYTCLEEVESSIGNYDFASMSDRLKELTQKMQDLHSHPVLCRQMLESVSSQLTKIAVVLGVDPGEVPIVSFVSDSTLNQSEEKILSLLCKIMALFSKSPERYHPEVRKAISYITGHYKEDISLSQIASHVSMSESYLSSIFKKDTGKGISNYLEEYRISQAIRLMNESRRPLYVISQEVGYMNVNYFSRVFKKVRGESPTQYMDRQKKVNKNKE